MAQQYTPGNYLWSDFVAAVTTLLGLEGQRTGSGVEAQRLALIRAGVVNLQTDIDQYRVNHETVYQPQDLVTEGHASRGVKPPQSVVRNAFLYKTCKDATTGDAKANRFDTDPWPWSDRFALVNGRVSVNSGRGYFCPDPQGYTFYVYPEVFDCWLMSIHWDGLKLDFGDKDETPFDEMTVTAVSHYVKAFLKTEVQDSQGLPTKQDAMRDFMAAKRACARREREKSQAKG